MYSSCSTDGVVVLLSDAVSGNHGACRRFRGPYGSTNTRLRLSSLHKTIFRSFNWMVLWNYQKSLLSFGKFRWSVTWQSDAGILYSIRYSYVVLTHFTTHTFTPVTKFLRLLYQTCQLSSVLRKICRIEVNY